MTSAVNFTKRFVRSQNVPGIGNVTGIELGPYTDRDGQPLAEGDLVEFSAGVPGTMLKGKIQEHGLLDRRGVETATVDVEGVEYIGPVSELKKLAPQGGGRRSRSRSRKQRKQKQSRQRTRRQRN